LAYRAMKTPIDKTSERRRPRFGLSTLLLAVWLAASLLALARGVVWPSGLSGFGAVLAIDQLLGRDPAKLQSGWVLLLMGLGTLFLAAFMWFVLGIAAPENE
jgi:hypothetical protein